MTGDGPLRWRDGAEGRLESILGEAADRSTASDDLASRINDWPTRYHLDRRRTNLLRPLHLGPGVRVLDAGAGTGVMSRYASEAGATVVAVEGDARRAGLVALRCEGTEVEVRCGAADEVDDPDGFDVVLAVGVLEYAAGRPGGAEVFLGRLAGLVRRGGVLVVAIENQLGLAYLLGADEDHLARPWVGLEGYPTAEAGVRTFSRAALTTLLTDAGLGNQQWLYPFPDYKLPVTILTEGAYVEPDAVDLVDQLVGPPMARHRIGHPVGADTRAVHREMVAAGLGTEVANSFLVVAAADRAALDARCDTSTLAWRFTGDRRRCYLGERRVTMNDGIRHIDRRRSYPEEPPPASWLTLRERHPDVDDYLTGPTLEQLALARLRAHDEDGLRQLLGDFHAWVTARTVPRHGDAQPHPFLPVGTGEVLPGECIDAGFDNLVPDGTNLRLVDDEWWAEGGVDPEMATVRALWKLAWVTVVSGTRHPWPATTSISQLALILCGLHPGPVGTDPLERLHAAEAELVAVACGGDPADHRESLREIGRRTTTDRATHRGPAHGLRRRLAWLKRFPGGRRLAAWTRPG